MDPKNEPAGRDERLETDRSLRSERDSADRHFEHEERRRAILSVLDAERGHTDVRLRAERGRADELLDTRDEFLGLVSHDLRSLIGNIVLETALLIRHLEPGEAGVAATLETATTIQRQSARMSRLVGDLVDVVSLDTGRLRLQKQVGDVRGVVLDAATAAATSARTRGTMVDASVPDTPLLADHDAERLLQVLANILGNAIKFSPDGGHIGVKVDREGADLHFVVHDSGPGIPADNLGAIFERHWQGDQQDRRGLGLGLFIAKRIVDEHGGRIWAESDPGSGSTFHIALPAAPDQPDDVDVADGSTQAPASG